WRLYGLAVARAIGNQINIDRLASASRLPSDRDGSDHDADEDPVTFTEIPAALSAAASSGGGSASVTRMSMAESAATCTSDMRVNLVASQSATLVVERSR